MLHERVLSCNGQTIFVADAHRGDGQRFVVHADERRTAFLELERAVCLRLLSEEIKPDLRWTLPILAEERRSRLGTSRDDSSST